MEMKKYSISKGWMPSITSDSLSSRTRCLASSGGKWQEMGKSSYIKYKTVAGEPGAESVFDRERNERFWRSLRKQAQQGRIKGAN